MAGDEEKAPIIVKKIKKGGHGHHGGAWKVAYADFVTAMMAFFLMMWLINMTSPEQKLGIAEYFAPASVSKSTSGSGGILGGTSLNDDGSASSGGKPTLTIQLTPPNDPAKEAGEGAGEGDSVPMVAEMDVVEDLTERPDSDRESRMFSEAESLLKQSLQEMPELAEMSKNVIIDETKEGLRIQLVDQDGRSMFPDGSVEPYERTKRLLRRVAEIVERLPNRIKISGHTDAEPLAGVENYTNWEMSSDRANAARRVIVGAGLDNDRIARVVGMADTEPLFPEDPYMAANRRITIVLLRENPVLPPGFEP